MSEAGKVSLPGMTPEEQMKQAGMIVALREAETLNVKLLAALEETQQQLWTAKEERDSRQRVCIKAMEELAEAQQTIETLRIAKDYEIGLHAQSCIDYQQTIARQREALTRINDLHVRGTEDKVCEPFRQIAKAALEGSNQA
jgi:hypothetical protein